MRFRLKILSFLSLQVLYLGGYACPCDTLQSLQDKIEASNMIFTGTVIGINSNWISGGMKYTFLVDQTWKRGSDSLLVVNTGWEYQCGTSFTQGERYLVYGQKKFNLKTNDCMGSKAIALATEDLELLGKGNPPRSSTMVPITGWAMGIMVFVAMAFLAFIILKKNNKS